MSKADASTPAIPEPDVKELRSLSFAELQAMFDAGNVLHITDVDDVRLVEKEQLVGKTFIITDWVEKDTGQYDNPFVIVHVTTPTDEHLVFTDGSTGIRDQLNTYLAKMGGTKQPIYVPKGLRVSNYIYHDELSGKDIPATTYYINNES